MIACKYCNREWIESRKVDKFIKELKEDLSMLHLKGIIDIKDYDKLQERIDKLEKEILG